MGRLLLVSLPATGGAAAVYRCKTQRYKEGKFILDRREVLATTATAAPPAAAHPSAASDDEGEDSD
jgi:hypothetical protein